MGSYHPGKSPPVLGYPHEPAPHTRHIVINEVAQTVIYRQLLHRAAPMPIVIAPMTWLRAVFGSGCVLQHTQRAYAGPELLPSAMHADLHKMPGKGRLLVLLVSVPNSMLSSAVSLPPAVASVAWRFGYRW